MKAKSRSRPSEGYSAPALDKGLDILELMADQKAGLTQSQIATALNRSIHQIYRMLNCLERRGYLHRAKSGDLYYLSMKTFEIAHRHAPLRGLLEIALPRMHELADRARQSCNLGTHSGGRVLIVAQADSPAPFGFGVKLGGLFPMLPNSAGRVLLAFQAEEAQRSWLESARERGEIVKRTEFLRMVDAVRARGYCEVKDKAFNGITISFPILGTYGQAVAALTIPYISSISFGRLPVSDVRALLRSAADAISRNLSGSQRQ